MNLLLDTHVLLWCLSDPDELRAAARDAIVDPGNIVFVSTATAWEIEIKREIGKLDVPDDLEHQLGARAFTELPIRLSHVRGLKTLPRVHRDPFDRMLVAQAIVDGLVIVTRDPAIPKYSVRTLRA